MNDALGRTQLHQEGFFVSRECLYFLQSDVMTHDPKGGDVQRGVGTLVLGFGRDKIRR